MSFNTCFFSQRDNWVAEQAQNGCVRLFDFCLDFGFKYDNLIGAGILQRSSRDEGSRFLDFALTEKGESFVNCQFDTFMVKSDKIHDLAAYVEEFFLSRFVTSTTAE